ncbi:MAG: helicase-exonuclease AddAB subunit AddA, partial [Clostridium sp.]
RIFEFFNSSLGVRLLNSYNNGYNVYRELPFYTEINASEVVNDLPEDVENEKVRLQGIIDCFFEEDDGIVLLDYKTDYIEDGNEEELIKRYEIQIRYYEEAIYRITGKKVKSSYLYSFYLNKEIEI